LSRLSLVAVGVAVGFFALIQMLVWLAVGGFEYPLDDVYIHLTIANSIARGEYGINAGEYASAASSVIYPALLAPFSGTAVERFVPLVINLIALVGVALVWVRIITLAGVTGILALGLAVVGPLALNFAGIAFTGMEHMLHVFVSLVIVEGLIRLGQTGAVPKSLMIAIVLCPLVRFEGLALSVMALFGIGFLSSWSRAAAVFAAMIAPLAAFVAFLTAHGIGPLPTSVTAKQALARGGELNAFDRLVVNAGGALHWPTAWPVFLGGIVLGFIGLKMARSGRKDIAVLALAGAATGLAHVVLGRFGWGFRYEGYAIAVVAAVWIAVMMSSVGSERMRLALIAGLLVVPMAIYPVGVIRNGVGSARAIAFQQHQMAVFAQDVHKGPVAVNDIGWVAWRNPSYVLDLYGLASREALRLRQDPASPDGWAGPLAAAKGVEVVMIYDFVFPRAKPPEWTKVAVLRAKGNVGWVELTDVDIYATSPALVEKIKGELVELQALLPDQTEVVFVP
jgi:hypothetical protein